MQQYPSQSYPINVGPLTFGKHANAVRHCLPGCWVATSLSTGASSFLGFGRAVSSNQTQVAWLEQSALFLVLAALALIAVIAPFVWREREGPKAIGEPHPTPTRPRRSGGNVDLARRNA